MTVRKHSKEKNNKKKSKTEDKKSKKTQVGNVKTPKKNSTKPMIKRHKIRGGNVIMSIISPFIEEMLKNIDTNNQGIIKKIESLFARHNVVYQKLIAMLKTSTVSSYIKSKVSTQMNQNVSPSNQYASRGGNAFVGFANNLGNNLRIGNFFGQQKPQPQTAMLMRKMVNHTKELSTKSQYGYTYILNLLVLLINIILPVISQKHNIYSMYHSTALKYPFIIKFILDSKERLSSDIYINMIKSNQQFVYYVSKTNQFLDISADDLNYVFTWLNERPQETQKIMDFAVTNALDPNKKASYMGIFKFVMDVFGVTNITAMTKLKSINDKYRKVFTPQMARSPSAPQMAPSTSSQMARSPSTPQMARRQ